MLSLLGMYKLGMYKFVNPLRNYTFGIIAEWEKEGKRPFPLINNSLDENVFQPTRSGYGGL